jgi:uncharacterized membrane protein YfcA
MEVVGFFALIGLGIILSLIGGGGSLLSLPILVYLFSIDIVTASTYSLFIVGASSLVGAIQKFKANGADLKVAFIFGCSSAVAIFIARRWIVPAVPDDLSIVGDFTMTRRAYTLVFFSLIVIASSLMLIMKDDSPSPRSGRRRLKFLVPLSFPTGLVAGMVGIGGGVIILPALVTLARLPFRIAVGTALLVISFNSLFGFLTDASTNKVDWGFLLLITFFSSIGMFVGNFYNDRLPERLLRLSFGWFLLVLGVCIILNEVL